MKILICAATNFELNAIFKQLFPCELLQKNAFLSLANLQLYFAETGIGPMVSAADTASLLATINFDAVLDVGICGSFRKEYPIGTAVFVNTDEFADFGIDNHGVFETAFQSGVMRERAPFSNGKLWADKILVNVAEKCHFPLVLGLTVGVATGSHARIKILNHTFNAEIESMEGASVYYAALTAGVPCGQLRTVSNMVTPRNKSTWDIPTALKALGKSVQTYLNEMNSKCAFP